MIFERFSKSLHQCVEQPEQGINDYRVEVQWATGENSGRSQYPWVHLGIELEVTTYCRELQSVLLIHSA